MGSEYIITNVWGGVQDWDQNTLSLMCGEGVQDWDQNTLSLMCGEGCRIGIRIHYH